MKTYSISEHYDTQGVITANSNPAEEFAIWQACASASPDVWIGKEFTLADFETYITSLGPAASSVPAPADSDTCTGEAQSKGVSYFCATSSNGTQFKLPTGGWVVFVTTIKGNTSTCKDVAGFATKEEAMAHAETLDMPWSSFMGMDLPVASPSWLTPPAGVTGSKLA